WYVLAAEPDAQVAVGLKRGVTREQLRHAIARKRAEELLNWVRVRAGEMIYVDAGTVHTIGPGVVLLETQQNSDTTYRLYDYGRPRELHVEQGLAATKEKTGSGKVVPSGQNGNLNLVTSPCFVVHRRQLKQNKEQIVTRHMPPSSVQIVVGLKGNASISANGQSAELLPGEAGAGAGWRPHHDPADGRAAAAAGAGGESMGHHQRGTAARDSPPASPNQNPAGAGRAAGPQYRARHRFGGIYFAASRSRRG